MTIRDANENDLSQLLDIYNDIILNSTAVYQYEVHTLQMRKEWFVAKRQQGFPVFVAEDNDRITGFSTIGSFRQWQAYKYSVENSVYVASDQRGKGIGKLLFDRLIEEAREKKFNRIIWQVLDWNEPAINFYKKYDAEFDDSWINCSIYV